MFQPAISAGVAARPMPYGLCASARVAHSSTATANAAGPSLGVGIGQLAVFGDAPGPDRVVMVDVIVAAHREQFGQRRLHVAGLVDGAALDYRRLAIPMPRQAEAGQRPRQYRLLQLCLLPALAVIDGYVDTLYFSASAPGDAANFVKTRRGQPLAARWPDDDGFGFHVEGEFARRTVGHWVGVFGGLIARVSRLRGDMQAA